MNMATSGSGDILIIDDDNAIRAGVKRILSKAGYTAEVFCNGQLAIEHLKLKPVDLIISDLKMPGMSGLEVLKAIRELQSEVPIIIITGYSTVDTAVEVMKNGAVDYLAKPFTPDQLLQKVVLALEQRTKRIEQIGLGQLHEDLGFDAFIGTSMEMQKVYQRIVKVAGTDSTILVKGESGTGKELVARAIHRNGSRKDQTFVTIDCTSLAESLLESELFGHVKGSFTGAIQNKTGLFQLADGGTLFLDEISNLTLTTQAKLLRFLQERVITPIGGTRPVSVNLRLVAATNRDLRDMVHCGEFREDLYFRLNIIPVDLPPLRERKGDLHLLIGYFLKTYARETGKTIRGISPDALAALDAYPFPGNVRELENHIERAVVLAQADIIQRSDLELETGEQSWQMGGPGLVPRTAEELKAAKQEVRERAVGPLERAFVLSALHRNDWNVTRAAEEVGMLRPNFQALLKKQGLSGRNRPTDLDA
jgi:DNA-binding NtrC family response regulator